VSLFVMLAIFSYKYGYFVHGCLMLEYSQVTKLKLSSIVSLHQINILLQDSKSTDFISILLYYCQIL
jgi:hypothetical protein